MHEGLTEDVVVGRGVLAVKVIEVVVEREPAFEGFLVDVALDEVFAHVVLLQQTLVLFDVGHGTMAERLAAARYRKAVLVAERDAGDFFEPVGVGAIEGTDVAGGILVDHILKLGGGEGHGARSDRLHAGLSVVFDRSLAGLGPASGDDDNTVGAAGTVDSGGGTVFEHVDGFNLLEVDAADIGIGHAIDDDERALAGSERSGASEQQLEGGVWIAAVGVGDGQTSYLTLEHSGSRGEGSFVEVVDSQADHGAGEFLFGGAAVADDYRFFEKGGGGGLETYHHAGRGGVGREDEVVVPHERYGDGCALGHAEGEGAVDVGHGVVAPSHENGTRNRLFVLVEDYT